MKNIRALVAAFCMSAGVVTVVSSIPVMQAQAAEEQKVGAKVGKPLQEALTAGQAKRWDEAVAKLKEADAVADKTAFEQHKINEIFAWVYVSQKKWADAATTYEKLNSDGFLSATEIDANTKTLVQMYMQIGNNAKATEYLQRWLKEHPNDTDMQVVFAQLQYKSGQYKSALDAINGVIANAEKAGQTPKEDWLKLAYGTAAKLNTNPTALDKQTTAIIEKLVRYYPNSSYWQALLLGVKAQVLSDGAKFQLLRLMQAVGTLKEADEWIEFAQLANNFGYPGEATSVLDEAFAKGILGTGAAKDREERLRASMQKAAETDKASLPALAKKSVAAATGQDDAVLGEAYLGYAQYPQAVEALERGIKKGGLKKADQAQLALGIAYLRSNQSDKAKAAFKQVAGEGDLARIASMWTLYANSKK